MRTRRSRGCTAGRPGLGERPERLYLFNGRYHVFFQYNPAAPGARRHQVGAHQLDRPRALGGREPIALTTAPGELDRTAAGAAASSTTPASRPRSYSAVPDDTSGPPKWLLARSDREMSEWRAGPRAGRAECRTTRDQLMPAIPFVFAADGHRYAIQGAGSRLSGDPLCVYGCDYLVVLDVNR